MFVHKQCDGQGLQKFVYRLHTASATFLIMILLVVVGHQIVDPEKSSVKNAIIIFVIGFLAFEFIEHVAIPLIWFIKNPRKRSNYGVMGMVGKVVEIKRWDKTEGQVLINGELWKAVCEVPLLNGDKAVVQDIEGLTLMLEPYED